MAISSRTPEGDPYLCPICGQPAALETSDAGDTVCPHCGLLLWQLRDCIADVTGMPADAIQLSDQLVESAIDSLELVELVMRFEDRFGVSPSDEEYEQLQSVEDVLRWLRRALDERE
jgi:acyl carrier protein